MCSQAACCTLKHSRCGLKHSLCCSPRTPVSSLELRPQASHCDLILFTPCLLCLSRPCRAWVHWPFTLGPFIFPCLSHCLGASSWSLSAGIFASGWLAFGLFIGFLPWGTLAVLRLGFCVYNYKFAGGWQKFAAPHICRGLWCFFFLFLWECWAADVGSF